MNTKLFRSLGNDGKYNKLYEAIIEKNKTRNRLMIQADCIETARKKIKFAWPDWTIVEIIFKREGYID